MRFLRLTTLILCASFALAACSSPTSADDDCTAEPELCGFPTTGS